MPKQSDHSVFVKTRESVLEQPRSGWLMRIVNRIIGRSDIAFGGSVYMRRWRMLHTRWFGVRVHNIVRSDSDRELHDHPFTFLSLILWGGYYEHRKDGSRTWYGPGSLVLRTAETLHRLELKEVQVPRTARVVPHAEPTIVGIEKREVGAWTLVFRGPMRRQWGFDTDEGWVPAYDFDRYKEAKANRGEVVAPRATQVGP